MHEDADEEVVALEAQINEAMVQRFPELLHLLVRPFSLELSPSEVWVVAQAGTAALFINLEAERFGVGFLADGFDLHNTQEYDTPELAAQAFHAAVANCA